VSHFSSGHALGPVGKKDEKLKPVGGGIMADYILMGGQKYFLALKAPRHCPLAILVGVRFRESVCYKPEGRGFDSR
jgi:hypothetical protein